MSQPEQKQGENLDDTSGIEAELASKSTAEIRQLTNLLGDEIRVMTSTMDTLRLNKRNQTAQIKENKEKIKLNCQLPYLIATIGEVGAGPAAPTTLGVGPAPSPRLRLTRARPGRPDRQARPGARGRRRRARRGRQPGGHERCGQDHHAPSAPHAARAPSPRRPPRARR